MIYHSSFVVSEGTPLICGCPILPIRSTVKKSPAKTSGQVQEEADIVDEAITFFRANVLFRSFPIESPADKLLIYLTLFINMALRRIEGSTTEAEGVKVLINLELEKFPIPGDEDFPITSLFVAPQTADESERLRIFLRQLREEASNRLLQLVYSSDGTPNKWWMAFAKRKFMNTILPL